MSGLARLLVGAALTVCCRAQSDCNPQAPCYSADTVVNIASGVAGALAPNTLVSLYGTNLSYSQRAVSLADINAGRLPTSLPGTGVLVYLYEGSTGYPAQLYLVSPGQINFLVPGNLIAGDVTLRVFRDSMVGPARPLKLSEAAPALFQLEPGVALVSRFDYSLVTPNSRARPGEWVILWATGLGAVTPPLSYGMLPTQPAWIARPVQFRVLLNDTPVPPERIAYAGVAVGYAGLYQVNLRLPQDAPTDPEVRIAEGDALSPGGVRLPISTQAP
jgi:uncharacterized protein (TIGR03437 family)